MDIVYSAEYGDIFTELAAYYDKVNEFVEEDDYEAYNAWVNNLDDVNLTSIGDDKAKVEILVKDILLKD